MAGRLQFFCRGTAAFGVFLFLLSGLPGCKQAVEEEEGGGGGAASPTFAPKPASAAQTVPVAVPTYPNPSVASLDPASGCSSGGCQKAVVEISINGSSNRRLTVAVGTPVTWSFSAKSTNYPTRQLQVFRVSAQPQPSSMQITGNGTASVSITWNPINSDAANGDLQITVRDSTACTAAKNATVPGGTAPTADNCVDFNTQNSSWDETQNFQWNLPSGSGSGQGGSNSNNNNLILAAGLGATIGLLTGQSLPGSLATGLQAALGTLTGGGATNGAIFINGNGGGANQDCYAYTSQLVCQNSGCQWNYNQCVNPGGLYPNGVPSNFPNNQQFPQNNNNGGQGFCQNFAQFQCQQQPGCTWNGFQCTFGQNSQNSCSSIFDRFQCQQANCLWDGIRCNFNQNGSGQFPNATPTPSQRCINLNIQDQQQCLQQGCNWNGFSCR